MQSEKERVRMRCDAAHDAHGSTSCMDYASLRLCRCSTTGRQQQRRQRVRRRCSCASRVPVACVSFSLRARVERQEGAAATAVAAARQLRTHARTHGRTTVIIRGEREMLFVVHSSCKHTVRHREEEDEGRRTELEGKRKMRIN